MPEELEAKFAVESLEPLRRVLARAGRERKPPLFERNVVFDTPARDLLAKGQLLRLRRCGGASTLTWKRPSAQAAVEGVKAMEEVQTRVEDHDAMRSLLLGLGYAERFLYEKVRQVWTLKQAEVCLDLLPFGHYVEIEGDRESIPAAAALLGLPMGRAMALTYHDLFREHLAGQGLPPADSFVFSDAQREALRRQGLLD